LLFSFFAFANNGLESIICYCPSAIIEAPSFYQLKKYQSFCWTTHPFLQETSVKQSAPQKHDHSYEKSPQKWAFYRFAKRP
jgi:hypothetical protein